ncbi:MAG: AMP-binding protein, partial [Roseovarius sp.]|nr:AMP-binding protein [Roseovarius sp.]
MSIQNIYHPSSEIVANSHLDEAGYNEMYAASINDPENFWKEQAKRVDWIKSFTKIKNSSYAPGGISIKWFEDGQINVSANCVDRHLETRGNQTAIIWEPDEPGHSTHITYLELSRNVNRLANVYKGLGIGKGDRIVLYMPMIPEAIYAMLACTRTGAIHSIVFAGFSSDALPARLNGRA